MVRITHIITGLNVGGAERALFSLVTGGLEGQFQNQVISLMDEGHYGPLLRQAGIPVTCLNMKRGLPSPGALLRLRAAIRSAPPDLIQGWMYHGNLFAFLAQRFCSIRVATVWNVRAGLEGWSSLKLAARGAISVGSHLSSTAGAIVYNSVRARDDHRKLGFSFRRDIVIPNGFDLETWRSGDGARRHGRMLLNVGPDRKLIGYVGRGDPDKDIPNLMAAFSKVRAMRQDIILICVGQNIEGFIPSGMRREGVTLLGKRDDVSILLPAFDVFCLSSRTEGFPNVIGEAMACGVPCITTDVGDAAAIVGETGWVVPPGDSDALAVALADALACGSAELENRGAAARQRIAENYSLAAVVKQYADLYESILRSN